MNSRIVSSLAAVVFLGIALVAVPDRAGSEENVEADGPGVAVDSATTETAAADAGPDAKQHGGKGCCCQMHMQAQGHETGCGMMSEGKWGTGCGMMAEGRQGMGCGTMADSETGMSCGLMSEGEKGIGCGMMSSGEKGMGCGRMHGKEQTQDDQAAEDAAD